jgi:hypothetical protein
MNTVTITRKIQLLIDSECKEQFIEELKKWKKYQRIVRRASNLVSSHAFMQDNIKDFFYLIDDVKLKLENHEKDSEGILKTSKMNSTYQMLSSKYKGEIPMSIMTCLNSVITKSYNADKMKIMTGQTSLRSYKKSVPIPFQSGGIINVKQNEDKNFHFTLFDTPFRTFFGRDRSNNKSIFSKAIYGLDDYKLCDSCILIDEEEEFDVEVGNGTKKVVKKNSNTNSKQSDAKTNYKKKTKIYLLATIKIPKTKKVVNPEKEIHCVLDPEFPIIINDGKYENKIGTYNDYIVGRIYIQKKIKEIQSALKYQGGGKGRKSKLQALERFKKKEIDFVKTKMHLYSRLLINHCVNNGIGKIYLDNIQQAKQEEDLSLIRNWSYFGLNQMIAYKATMNNIEVVTKKTLEEIEKEKEIKLLAKELA